MATLYNANVRAAYVAGEYDGIRTIDQVVAHGGSGSAPSTGMTAS